MTRFVNIWKCLIFIGYSLQTVYTGTTYTSEACYGSGPHCTWHNLSCTSTRKITFYDAYFTNNTECGAGVSVCHYGNLENVTEHGYHAFNNTELLSLYNMCSTQNRCAYRGPRRSAVRTFSVVKYKCIEDDASLNISGGSAEGLFQVSLFNRDEVTANSTMQNNTYMCSFKSDNPSTSISVYSLDVRMRQLTPGQCMSRLTVLPANYITLNNCSMVFHPFERLNVTARLPTSIYIEIPSVYSTWIWLLINASDRFDVKCEPLGSTGEITTLPNKDGLPIPTPSGFLAGVFMGGVASGAVIVILVGLAVYFFVIRRRYDLTVKKQGDTPASVEHPTYSGLSAGGDVNNYTSIEQTSRSQEDATHRSTATPDYQNI